MQDEGLVAFAPREGATPVNMYHRGAPYDTKLILGDARFNGHTDNFPGAEICEELSSIACQDELPPQYRYSSLEWVLLRLFTQGAFNLREIRTDSFYDYLDQPRVGLWNIQLSVSNKLKDQ